MSIVLNADDFGLGQGIDRGILQLLERGRLSGVSVMASAPRWTEDGPAIAPFAKESDIGLHFALTEVPTLRADGLRQTDGRPYTFGELQLAAWRRRIDPAAVRDELGRQWRRFQDVLGQPPAHLDSHQHVHQLPGVRAGVLEFLDGLGPGERPYVRTTVERPRAILRRGVHPGRALAFAWAGRRLRHGLWVRRHPTNDGFSGVYDFRARDGYRTLFRRFLRDVRNGTIVICHPGVTDAHYSDDPIAAARTQELAYFAGEEVLADLAAAGVSIGRFGAR